VKRAEHVDLVWLGPDSWSHDTAELELGPEMNQSELIEKVAQGQNAGERPRTAVAMATFASAEMVGPRRAAETLVPQLRGMLATADSARR
jgi:hypothetical protein